MSCEALRWAFAQPLKGVRKLLLLCMAHRAAGADMVFAVSTDELKELSGLDRKTVIAVAREMREAGYVVPTGQRHGRTHSRDVCRLSSPKNGTPTVTAPAEGQPAAQPGAVVLGAGSSPEYGTPSAGPPSSPEYGTPQGLTLPINGTPSPASSPENGTPSPLSSTEYGTPFTGQDALSSMNPMNSSSEPPVFLKTEEPLVQKGENARARVPARPEDVSEEVWADWLQLRKRKRAPVTATVLRHARKEAGKADMPLEAFLEVWCGRGSQGLEAEWLKPDERTAWRGRTGAQMRLVNGGPLVDGPAGSLPGVQVPAGFAPNQLELLEAGNQARLQQFLRNRGHKT